MAKNSFQLTLRLINTSFHQWKALSYAPVMVCVSLLAKQVGGRFEPIGEAIQDSSMQWRSKAGAGGMINK